MLAFKTKFEIKFQIFYLFTSSWKCRQFLYVGTFCQIAFDETDSGDELTAVTNGTLNLSLKLSGWDIFRKKAPNQPSTILVLTVKASLPVIWK